MIILPPTGINVISMSEAPPIIERNVSWLAFNHRVLQEAADLTVPLYERIKFLAIYSSNLGEYFAVRVAQQRNLLRIGKKTKRELDIQPRTVLKNILSIVNQHQEEFSYIFEYSILPELRNHGIHIAMADELTVEQKAFVEDFFLENMLPFVQPVLLVKSRIRPFLTNASLYLALSLRIKDKPDGTLQYAIVKVPAEHLTRFIVLPGPPDSKEVIMIDDVVRHNVSSLFPGYDILGSYSIKLTRDAELYIDDEFSGDLLQKIKKSLKRRNVGPASRLVYDRNMPPEFLRYLQEVLELDKLDLLPEGRYHNNFDFFNFPDFGLTHLKLRPLDPLPYAPIEDSEDIFRTIRQGDHLLHLPYHSFQSVVKLFEEAARDPHVTHIKIIQYRVGETSSIMNALVDAAARGKRVSAFMEVKARFDEENNIQWGQFLEKAGVKVYYSFPGLKVHSKAALIRRLEGGKPVIYAYFSTGNFHEVSAKIYSDLGLFTADNRLTQELGRIFSVLETRKLPTRDFQHLLVGQFNLRTALTLLIQQEIEHARAGRRAVITLKMNSLQDTDMINLLYEAGSAGVTIRLIVRGICCLIPGEPGLSENISAVSIVDRYLEHARIFHFYNDGANTIYLSSADWMTRNLSYRIETVFPLYDKRLKRMVMDILDLQLSDNVKARIIDKLGENRYVRTHDGIPVQSQLDTYFYLKRLPELAPADAQAGARSDA